MDENQLSEFKIEINKFRCFENFANIDLKSGMSRFANYTASYHITTKYMIIMNIFRVATHRF
jgi:hypothetical protein